MAWLPAARLGVMACAGLCSSSLSVKGVEKWSLFGLSEAAACGVAETADCSTSPVPPGCVGGVCLKKDWIGGDPLRPAPLHSFRKFEVLMTRCCPSR